MSHMHYKLQVGCCSAPEFLALQRREEGWQTDRSTEGLAANDVFSIVAAAYIRDRHALLVTAAVWLSSCTSYVIAGGVILRMMHKTFSGQCARTKQQ